MGHDFLLEDDLLRRVWQSKPTKPYYHPGKVLENIVFRDLGETVKDIMQKTGLKKKVVRALLKGEVTVDDELAEALAQGFAPSKEEWLEHQRLFDYGPS